MMWPSLRSSPQRAIRERAARWVVRNQEGVLPAAEREEFHQWLAADRRHRTMYLANLHAWESAGLLRSRERLGAVARTPAWLPRRARVVALAAAVAVLAVALGVALTMLRAQEGWTVYQTEANQSTRVLLADGSTLELSGDSRVRVHMARLRRSVMLMRGQAAFRVTHEPTRPFEVTAAGFMTRVVGTVFSVRMPDSASIEVRVSEGRVALGPAAALRAAPDALPPGLPLVRAGEVATAGPAGVMVRRIAEERQVPVVAGAGTEPRRFQGETLAEAVAAFNQNNPQPLRIADPALAQLRIGGVLRPTDEAGFIAALAHTFGIRAVPRDGEILLTRPAP